MLAIHLDLNSRVPLYEQIYEFIKNEIISGSLLPESKLPSTRGLSSFLQVSRNTIDMAYGQLLSEGYIESYEKKGYFVCHITNMTHIKDSKYIAPAIQNENNSIRTTNFLSEETQNELSSTKVFTNYIYDFSPFSIDLDSFPYNTWRKLSKNALNDNNDLFLLGHNQGDEKLRDAIARYLHQSRGVICTTDQIIVGAGTDYLLQLLSQLIPKEHIIAMENPTYMKAYHIFHGLHYNIAAIPLDHNGINIKELHKSNASITYVTPSHQYPLGIVMPINRRLELLNWAANGKDRYIIEDDHDSEFRYKGKPIPSLQGMDVNDKVIYIGTFSRAIAPAIRIGYLVLPNILLDLYKKYLYHYSCSVSRIDQAIITNFIDKGYFERHLNKMRKIYKNKHDILINALKIFGDSIEILGENAGLHLVIRFKLSLSELTLIDTAKSYGIHLYGISDHYIKNCDSNFPTILLGYAKIKEADINEGIQLLYQALSPYINPTLIQTP